MAEIITFFGRTVDRNRCRFIKGSFYECGRECFEIDGTWHRINNSKIGFNVPQNKWMLMEQIPTNYCKVLVGMFDNVPCYGYIPITAEEMLGYVQVSRDFESGIGRSEVSSFLLNTISRGISSAEAMQNYSVYADKKRGKNVLAIEAWYEEIFKPKLMKTLEEIENSEFMNYYQVLCEKSLAIKLGHKEYPQDGVFYLETRLTKAATEKLTAIKTYPLRQYGREYTTVGHAKEKETIRTSSLFAAKLPTHAIDAIIARYIPYTFGIEHETIRGFIAERRLPQLGLIPLRDGSLETGEGLAGIEYTTIPMHGTTGIQLLREQCELLNKHCEISNKCAHHIHFSGFPLRWEYVMNLYHLCRAIEDEMYSMFPLYKRDTIGVIGGQKNYTAPLPKISSPKELFKYLGGGLDEDRAAFEGMSFADEAKVQKLSLKMHPQGDQKWNRPGRYHWANFEPIVFSNAQTFEMRLHTPTTNFVKIVSWLLICSAILRAAETYKKGTEITLNQIIKSHLLDGTREGDYLYEFVSTYTGMRKSWYVENKDPKGEKEIKGDKKFEYHTKMMVIE